MYGGNFSNFVQEPRVFFLLIFLIIMGMKIWYLLFHFIPMLSKLSNKVTSNICMATECVMYHIFIYVYILIIYDKTGMFNPQSTKLKENIDWYSLYTRELLKFIIRQ